MGLSRFTLKHSSLRSLPINVNAGISPVVDHSDRLLSQFLVRYVSANSILSSVGVNEFVFIQKLMGHTQLANFGFAPAYKPPAFSSTFSRLTANLCANVRYVSMTQTSTAFTVYRTFSGAVAAIPQSDVILYDFDWCGALNSNTSAASNLVRANFVSGVLFQASIRQLQQQRSL